MLQIHQYKKSFRINMSMMIASSSMIIMYVY